MGTQPTVKELQHMGFIVPPSKWEIRNAKPIFAAQKYQATNNNRLPDTPAWRMLEMRHNLNPTRFDFYHPNVGRMIDARDDIPPTVPPVNPPPAEQTVKPWEGTQPPPTNVGPQVDPPPDSTGTGNPPPTVPNQQVVPEPASVLMFAIAIITLGLGFHRLRGRADRPESAPTPA